MNVRFLQQAGSDRARSLLTSLIVIVLALGGILVLGLLSRPSQRPAPAVALTTPEARPALPGPIRLPAAAPAVQEAWPPVEGTKPVSGSTFVSRLQNMLLVLTLVSLLVWALLRMLAPNLAGMAGRPGGRRKLVNILERQSLGPGKGLVMIEVAGRHLLLGMTEQGVHTLAELTAEEIRVAQDVPEEAPAASVPAPPEPTRNLLQEVLSKHLSAVPGLSSRQRGS